MTPDGRDPDEQASATVDAALVRTAREDSGRVLAFLTRRFGDLDLADEAVQEALIEASNRWPQTGVPDRPGAWLATVAKRKAIDRLRRAETRDRRQIAAGIDLARTTDDDPPGRELMIDHNEQITDDRLRLLFLCCHPAIDPEAQIALTLRLVGGLTTREIAAAFVVPEATLAQRIVRAKRKIRDAGIPMSVPNDLDERLDSVLSVLYLVFNEGYASHAGTEHLRLDLTTEAIRLTEVLVELVPDSTEALGLLALELFHHARSASRVDRRGDLVLLEDQDRTTWDLATIRRANRIFGEAMAMMRPGPYQLQALIASYHANAATAGDTDWPSIATAYRQLTEMSASPVVRLNHAIAVAMADGPGAGLALIDRIEGLEAYHLLHTTRANLCAELGRFSEAADAYRRALPLTDNPTEVRFIERRLTELG